jgi:hypothetical protein
VLVNETEAGLSFKGCSLYEGEAAVTGAVDESFTVHDNGLADPAEAMAGNLHQIPTKNQRTYSTASPLAE